MNKQLAIAATLFASVYFLPACNNDNSKDNTTDTTQTETVIPADTATHQMDNGLMSTMNSMMDKMNNMQMTGDFDHDFATMMIAHHQGAVDMSQIEVSKGTDEKMKTMAENIITKQTEEIKMLQNIIDNHKASEMKMGEGELQKSMADMKGKMNSMQMTGNTDKDFAMMMVSHHEAAVSMFKSELSHGKNSQLKQMAQKGITDQTKEINEMKAWMKAK